MDSKEDDEISIDFSKVKKFFKSEKDEEKKEDVPMSIKAENTAPDSKHKSEQSKIDWNEKREELASKDDEVSIDFSKIKNVFKSTQRENNSDEELQINWSKSIDFFKKYGIIFIALIPIILAIYIRMQAGSLAFTDGWAYNTVINGIQSQIRAGIDQQYPNLPDANKNPLVQAQLDKVISEHQKQVDDTIRAYSGSFKAFFQDEKGNAYMSDIDPYYWVRYAQNIVDHGHPGDILKDGRPFDNHQLAPRGRFVAPNLFHPYALAYFYKFLRFFSDISLMRSSFLMIPLVSSICVLFVFLIGKKIAGNLGGFFAALMMAVNGAFLSRSLHPDDDIWVVLFPLLITWLFFAVIDSKKIRNTLAASIIAGFLTGIFSFSWNGWWFIFDFLVGTMLITLFYLFVVNFSDIRNDKRILFSNIAIRDIAIFALIYILSSAIFVGMFSGLEIFQNSIFGPLGFQSIKAPLVQSTTNNALWPNVLTTVAELNEGSINASINSVGGALLFFISLVGLALAVSRQEKMSRFDFIYIFAAIAFYAAYFLAAKMGFDISVFGFLAWILLPLFLRMAISIYKKEKDYDFKLAILLSLWVISTIYASLKGIRFTLLLAPAFSVAFGVALGKFYNYISKFLTKEFKIHKFVSNSILVLLFLLIFVSPIRGAISSAGNDMPIVNDAWYNTDKAIKTDSKENAIITSWWDFGHHFKALADRPVTFDGTTQTYPPAHWVGKLLMTSDEAESKGILRMLNCDQNNAYDKLYNIYKDPHKALKIIDDIIKLDKPNARNKLLGYGLTPQETEDILNSSHCNPPEAYFIASDDMIGKSGVWGHFGAWNYERADIWRNARTIPQEQSVQYMIEKFNYSKEKAENTYFEMQSITTDSAANTWISPWPGYGGTASCSKKVNDIYVCSNGFQVNLSNNDVFAFNQQGIVRPKIAAFTTADGISFTHFNGTTIDFGVTIIPKSKNEITAVLSSKELTGGMFTRMFYMQGHGLKYFKLFNHQRGLTGTDIYTYKLDWSGTNTTIVKEYSDFFNKPPMEENVNQTMINMQPAENTSATNTTITNTT